METNEMVVLADGIFVDEAQNVWGNTLLPVVEWPEDLVQAGELLEKLYNDGRKGFVVYGGDSLVGRVVTAYWRRRSLGAQPLNLWPIKVGETYVAGEGATSTGPRKAARRAKKGIHEWETIRVGTLKVTSSTERAAWYGFSFGAGWVYQAFCARQNSRGGAGNFVTAFGRLATDTWRVDDGSPVAHRVAVDHRPAQGRGGSVVVSTLGETYFGLGSSSGTALLWDQLSTAALVRRAVTPGLLETAGPSGQRFESLHLDTPKGWVLDGRLFESGDSGVVQVVPGPTVTVMRPRRGLKVAVGRLWN